jgi:HNH endonuclease
MKRAIPLTPANLPVAPDSDDAGFGALKTAAGLLPLKALEIEAHIRRTVVRRARCRCQVYGRWGALEVHHVVKRAQGGSDFDLDRLVALCPPCHAQTDAAYARGRLVITPLGDGRFTVEVTRGVDKWAIRA